LYVSYILLKTMHYLTYPRHKSGNKRPHPKQKLMDDINVTLLEIGRCHFNTVGLTKWGFFRTKYQLKWEKKRNRGNTKHDFCTKFNCPQQSLHLLLYCLLESFCNPSDWLKAHKKCLFFALIKSNKIYDENEDLQGCFEFSSNIFI